MRKPILATLVAMTSLLAAAHVLDTSLYPARIEGDRWGYIAAESGFKAINDIYDEARPFYDGRAAVSVLGSWGFIDRNGSLAVPLRYKQVTNFYDGRAFVVAPDGPVEIIDTTGTRVGSLGSGTMLVTPQGHVIRTALNGATSLLTYDGTVITDGLDHNGRYLITGELDGGRLSFKDRYTQLTGLMDLTGTITVPARYDVILLCDHATDLAVAQMSTPEGLMAGLIDAQGHELLPIEFFDIDDLGHGLFGCERENGKGTHIYDARAHRWLYRDNNLKIINPSDSPSLLPAYDGTAWGYVDSEGRWMIEPSYVMASGFNGGTAAVALDEADTPGDYHSILITEEGLAAGGRPRFCRYIQPIDERSAITEITDDAFSAEEVADAILSHITPERVVVIPWDATVEMIAKRDNINYDTFATKYVFVMGLSVGNYVNIDLIVDGRFTDGAGRVVRDARCSSITVVAQLYDHAEENHAALARALLSRLGIDSDGGSERREVTIAGRRCVYEKVGTDLTFTFEL